MDGILYELNLIRLTLQVGLAIMSLYGIMLVASAMFGRRD